MNHAGISLGEMGGGGEGQWDGVPMATLMRRALEECRTLDTVLTLWRENPRTCEYYYVFADVKGRRAVGVAATPERIEVVLPGEAHPRLGPDIADSVVLSSGNRLETLRERIIAGASTLDTASAVRFPSPRPPGDTRNDSVWMEWYAVRDTSGDIARAPTCVVVHKSGSGMQFGRLIAKGLREQGVHAFLVHLPHYGRRRDPVTKPGAERLVLAVTQAVADVRRARDAVAALDRGYSKTFIMLAGADLPAVLSNGQKDAEKVRMKLAAAGMSDAQVRDTLHAIEPLRLAHRLPPDRTWLYSAQFDEVVPPRNADLLVKAAGLRADHHVRLAANHYTGIFYLPAILVEVTSKIHE